MKTPIVYSCLCVLQILNFLSAKPLTTDDNEEAVKTFSSPQTSAADVGSLAVETATTEIPSVVTLKIENGSATLSPLSTDISDNIVTDPDFVHRQAYAKLMLTYMNESVNPCDDFYEYACGNWKNVKADHETAHKRNNLLDLAYTLDDNIDKILQRPADELKLDYVHEFQLVQNFYRGCLTAQLLPMKASVDYLNALREMGGFPAVEGSAWNASAFNWLNMSAHMSNYGVKSLINEKVLPQFPFPPYFKMPDLGFDSIVHSDNIESNETRAYKLNEQRMRTYLHSYGVEEEKIDTVIEEVFQFWHEALALADTFDEDIEKCAAMSEEAEVPPFSQWSNYMEIAWKSIDFGVEEDDCPCNYYYIELDKICERHKSAVANYLSMQFLYHMDANLKAPNYQKDYCLMSIRNNLPYLLDKLYLQEFLTVEKRTEVASIIKEMRKSLREVLERADWLDEATRAAALKKESTIIERIGHYEDDELSERLIRELNNLTYVADDYEQNNLNMHKFHTFMRRYIGYNYPNFSNETKPLELLVGIQVNAFYYNVDNSIQIMAGILNPPAYHHAWPYSLKYGTIGYLIGHEFTHGFDTVGATYDSDGKMNYWWSKKSGTVFNERANCFAEHYNSYLIPEINRNINGNQTKDENIADSGGLRTALSAYRSFIKKLINDAANESDNYSLRNEQMPGMDHTPEQLFFLGFAQLWCAAYKEEHYWEEYSNEHTVDKYRVLGAVTNNDDFADAYNCATDTKMNPQGEKCRVWW